jgi:hypothetical protein
MHFAPSKVADEESLNSILAFQSGNIETNIPQTGHFSFWEGGALSGPAANEATARKKMIKKDIPFFIRPPAGFQ